MCLDGCFMCVSYLGAGRSRPSSWGFQLQPVFVAAV